MNRKGFGKLEREFERRKGKDLDGKPGAAGYSIFFQNALRAR
jgi:hypothetical protein